MFQVGKPDEGGEPLYKNKTMVGNWWEDRHLPKEQLSTKERVLSCDPDKCQSQSMTTKREFDNNMLKSRGAVALADATKKPSLYVSEVAVKERLATYMPDGKPPADITYTLGRTMVQEANQPVDRYLHTTNNHFYKDLPAQARQADPAAASGRQDKTHFRTSAMEKELASCKHLSETKEVVGSKGSRGEITRRPCEAGNPYGVSVFVDEYAAWGTKLAGMTLGETVSRKRTAYF